MEPTLSPEIDLHPRVDEEALVHEWRAEKLRDLGLPHTLADKFADLVDWHQLHAIVARGCPPELALDIVR
jgi:hypothetical protein